MPDSRGMVPQKGLEPPTPTLRIWQKHAAKARIRKGLGGLLAALDTLPQTPPKLG
jgi:hypothetical protein